MDKYEYWFLDSAIKDVIGLSWIVPNEQNCLAVNRLALDLNVAEISGVLDRLFQRGDLAATTPADCLFQRGDLAATRGFTPSHEQIVAALNEQIPLSYFLTVQGGERWEAYSKPDWSKYFSGVMNLDTQEAELEGATKNVIDKYLEVKCFLSNIYWCISGTEIWETLTPYHATYWKSLPVGYRVRYQFKEGEIFSPSETDLNYSEYQQANEWYSNIRKWYIDYFAEES
jgi:hypothetical protein